MRVEFAHFGQVAVTDEGCRVLRVVLEHVAHFDRAGKPLLPKGVPGHGSIGHLFFQSVTQRGGILLAGEVIASDTDGPADVCLAAREEFQCRLAYVANGDAGHRLVGDGQGQTDCAVSTTSRWEGVDEALEEQRGAQKCCGHPVLTKQCISLGLGIEVRNLEPLLDGGYPVVVAEEVTSVLQCGPHHVFDAGLLGRARRRISLRQFPFRSRPHALVLG